MKDDKSHLVLTLAKISEELVATFPTIRKGYKRMRDENVEISTEKKLKSNE